MRRRPLCLVGIALMTAIWIMKLAGIPVFGESPQAFRISAYLSEEETARLSGVIAGRTEKPGSTQYILNHSYLLYRQEKIPFHQIIITTQEKEHYRIGDCIEAEGSLKETELPGNPGEFNSREYYGSQGIFHTLWAEKLRLMGRPAFSFGEILLSVRTSITEALQGLMDPETAGVMAAMVFGDREALPEEVEIDYRIGGVIHAISVSGVQTLFLAYMWL
jgi:competence protein ComEC